MRERMLRLFNLSEGGANRSAPLALRQSPTFRRVELQMRAIVE